MRTRRTESGFMLLEVMLAVAFLAVALFALINALSRCLSAAQSVQNYSIAQTLLANKAYEFRVERPADDLNQEGEFTDYPNYKWSRALDSIDSEELKGVWKQTISVSWTERGQTMTDSIVEYRYLPEKQ